MSVVTNLCALGRRPDLGLPRLPRHGHADRSTPPGWTPISGLVMITPSAGFIDMPTAATLFGVCGALLCRQALRIKST